MELTVRFSDGEVKGMEYDYSYDADGYDIVGEVVLDVPNESLVIYAKSRTLSERTLNAFGVSSPKRLSDQDLFELLFEKNRVIERIGPDMTTRNLYILTKKYNPYFEDEGFKRFEHFLRFGSVSGLMPSSLGLDGVSESRNDLVGLRNKISKILESK